MKRLLTLTFIMICCLQCFADLNEGREAYQQADYATALREYQILSDKGDAEGQYSLANLFRDGKGVKKDLKQAFKWMTLSAGQGHILALYALGSMYKYGKGVEKNPMEAYKLVLLAQQLNVAEKDPETFKSAKEMCDLELEYLAKQLTSDQIKKATFKAREWKIQGKKGLIKITK